MTYEEALTYLQDRYNFHLFNAEENKAIVVAIKALKEMRDIESIINTSNLIIQEDVLKYKMIVDVVKGDW